MMSNPTLPGMEAPPPPPPPPPWYDLGDQPWVKPDDINFVSCPRCNNSDYIDHYQGEKLDCNHDSPAHCCRKCGQVWPDWDSRDHEEEDTSFNDSLIEEGWIEKEIILPQFVIVDTTYLDYPINEHYTFRETTTIHKDGHISYSYNAYKHGTWKGWGLCGNYRNDHSGITETMPLAEWWPVILAEVEEGRWKGVPSGCELPEPIAVADPKAPATLHPDAERWVEFELEIESAHLHEGTKFPVKIRMHGHYQLQLEELVERGQGPLFRLRGNNGAKGTGNTDDTTPVM